jgi:hypothetical protein
MKRRATLAAVLAALAVAAAFAAGSKGPSLRNGTPTR